MTDSSLSSLAMNSLISLENVKDGTKCCFLLPKNYTVPTHLAKSTSQECELAFHVADQVLASKEKYCLEEYSSTIVTDLTRSHEEEVEKLRNDHKRHLQKLDGESKSALLEQDTYYKKKVADLEVRIERLSSSQDVIRQQFLEEANRRVEQQKESDTQLFNHINAELERVRSEKKELESKLHDRVTIQSNSSKRGRQGEQVFENILKEEKGWILSYTGNKSHALDYLLSLYDLSIRFDVKDYSHTVPGKEVEKIRRDLHENQETDIGVFVSLNSGIANIHCITQEWTSTNQLILFIPYFLSQDIPIVLDSLDLIIQVMKRYRTALRNNLNDEESSVLKNRIEHSLVYARNGIARLTQSLGQFTTDVEALLVKVEDMKSHMRTNFAAQKEELQSMIAILCGQEVSDKDTKEMPDKLPLVHDEKKKSSKTKKKSG